MYFSFPLFHLSGCLACKSGYKMSPENGCMDINECASGDRHGPCRSSQFCVNNDGSYSCLGVCFSLSPSSCSLNRQNQNYLQYYFRILKFLIQIHYNCCLVSSQSVIVPVMVVMVMAQTIVTPVPRVISSMTICVWVSASAFCKCYTPVSISELTKCLVWKQF